MREIIRNAQVLAVRDTIPDAYCDRDRDDLVAVDGVVDSDAAFAISGNGKPDHDVSLAGMLRARPQALRKHRRYAGAGPVQKNLRVSGNLQPIAADARGNLLGCGGNSLGDVVDMVTSRPVLLIAAIAGWYFMLHPEKIPWRKKA